MASLVKAKVSAVVSQQLPEFVREDHPQFGVFLKAYYEWLEQNYPLRELESIMSIDSTLDEYVEYFADQLMHLLPKAMVADRRLILKHAKDLYLAKGTPGSYELLFKLMFNETPQQIYYPKRDMLRISDGKWSSNRVIRAVQIYDDNGTPTILEGESFELVGQTLFQDAFSGLDKPASARVESIIKYYVGTQLINEITISEEGVIGFFEPNQLVYGTSNVSGQKVELYVLPFISKVTIDSPGKYYSPGDLLSVISGDGSGFRAEVASIQNGSVSEVKVVAGGDGHYVGQPVIFDNTDAGYGGSSSVESATAYVSEVEYGYFMLEDTDRWAPATNYFSTGARIVYDGSEYQVVSTGRTSDTTPPSHLYGTLYNGTVALKYVGSASGRLVAEDEYPISLERDRVYRIDEFGNYIGTDTQSDSEIIEYKSTGAVKAVKLTYGGKHYNKLPKAYTATDYISAISTPASGDATVNVTTVLPHGLTQGDTIVLVGTAKAVADGTFVVSAVVDLYNFKYVAPSVTKLAGNLQKFGYKQYFYPIRQNTNLQTSKVKLKPLSQSIGAVTDIVIANFGYGYNNAVLHLPSVMQVEDTVGVFLNGETVEIQSQTLALEITGDEFLLEDGQPFELEQQLTSSGIVKGFDRDTNVLQLSPSDVTFRNRGRIVGQTSGASAKILDVSAGLVTPIITGNGLTAGKFTNSDGKVSDASKRIQDSFYYQDYSYVIRIGQSVNKYRDAVKKLLHPVGLAMFGEVSLINAISALMRIMNGDKAVLTSIIDTQTRASVLAVGNWQEETYRVLYENSDVLNHLGLEGGYLERFVTEDGKDRIISEDNNIFITERSDEDGRIILLENGDKFNSEEQISIFEPEHVLGETYNFFRLENDTTHTKSRTPDKRKEQWIVRLEDFVPSYYDSDTLKLETATLDNDGIVVDEGNDLLLEDGGRILNQIQLSKPAPSMRVLQSEMLPPVIIPEMDINTVHLLEMSPEVFKELVFNIKTKVAMDQLRRGVYLLETGDQLLLENGDSLSIGSTQYPETTTEQYVAVTMNPTNVELDNLLLETGYLLQSEDTETPGYSYTVEIDDTPVNARVITMRSLSYQMNNPIFIGMRTNNGFRFIFNDKYDLPEGTVTDTRKTTIADQEYDEWDVLLDYGLLDAIDNGGATKYFSIVWSAPRNKFVLDSQSQHIFAGNFATDMTVIDNKQNKVIRQIRPSFASLGSSFKFLEQRKFTFPPYTYGSAGSLQVVPGTSYVGTEWAATTPVLTKQVFNYNGNAYEVTVAGTTGLSAPTHTSGSVVDGDAELTYIGPAKDTIQYLPDDSDGGFTGGWYLQYPAPNREYWNNETITLESGDTLLTEAGGAQLVEVSENSGDVQIKDFENVTLYDVINRKHKRTNYAVGSYIEIYKGNP